MSDRNLPKLVKRAGILLVLLITCWMIVPVLSFHVCSLNLQNKDSLLCFYDNSGFEYVAQLLLLAIAFTLIVFSEKIALLME